MQGSPRDAAVNLGIYQSIRRHHAVSLAQHGILVFFEPMVPIANMWLSCQARAEGYDGRKAGRRTGWAKKVGLSLRFGEFLADIVRFIN